MIVCSGISQPEFHSNIFSAVVSAAGTAFSTFLIIIRLEATAAFASLSSQHGVDDSRRAADARIYKNSSKRTIAAACSTFHTGVAILNDNMGTIHFKNLVRTNLQAHSAAGAYIFVKP